MNPWQDHTILVDGIRTHYLEAGDGPPVVLLHAGEFGGAAELSWEHTIPALAEQYRVIAPDWLGFGYTDKLHDFVSGAMRRLDHMVRLHPGTRSAARPHLLATRWAACCSLGQSRPTRRCSTRPRR